MNSHTFLLAVLVGACATSVASAQNSMRKIRPQPSEIASRAGMSVEWRTDADAALEESSVSGKPVFWYVPTIQASPMDRKDVVDRSMMAGPFSWPRVISMLNEHFIPMRRAGRRPDGEAFGLKPIEFIEPGYLILDGADEVIARVDEITTLHPAWFLARLGEHVGVDAGGSPLPGTLDPALGARILALETAVLSDWDATIERLSDADRLEATFLRGVGEFEHQRTEDAVKTWADLAAAHPGTAWGAKAAMEAEGLGPYVAGLETYVPLSGEALAWSGDGTRRPDVYSEDELWRRGVDFLLKMQREDGGFRESRYDFGGTDSLPNVYVACTAIAAWALLEASSRLDDPAVDAALEKAVAYICDDSHLAKNDTDEIVWASLYPARLFTRWIDLRPEDKGRMEPLLQHTMDQLADQQETDGAWGHEYTNPFVTAQALVAMGEARRHGVAAEKIAKVVEKGVAALMQCRAANGAYTYSMSSGRRARAAVEAGVGRMPLGEHALLLWKVGKPADLARGLDLSFSHDQHLNEVRKYDNHANRYAYGGFFFWYDLQVRVDAIRALKEGAVRDRMLAQQWEQILDLPEFDGCFVDSHELGRPYGTAMALICLGLIAGDE